MNYRYFSVKNQNPKESNIFANKSALIPYWLLTKGKNHPNFSLRNVSLETGVSLGLVQRVFKNLVHHGFLQVQGVRTAKKYCFKAYKKLLKTWCSQYHILKKSKSWTYKSPFNSRKELIEEIKKSPFSNEVALALHSATETYGASHTNLITLELYLLKTNIREMLVKELSLEPQESGYEVLLIEPYYKALVTYDVYKHNDIKVTPPLLTYLDLLHFPLRGEEQANYLLENFQELKDILDS